MSFGLAEPGDWHSAKADLQAWGSKESSKLGTIHNQGGKMKKILIVIAALFMTGCGQVEKVYMAKYDMVDAGTKKIGTMDMTLRLRMSPSGELTSVGTLHITNVNEVTHASQEGLTEPILKTISNCDFFDEDNWACKDGGTITSMREGKLSIQEGYQPPILFDVGGWYIKPLNYTLQTGVSTRTLKVGS
jgi:hypothetical protein